MWNLADDLLSKLGECCELKRRTDFSDIETIRGLDGREVGGFHAFGGGKLEKVAVARLSLAEGVEYNYIHFLPLPCYRIPDYVYESMSMGGATSFSLDLYPPVDLVADPEHFARYRDRLEDIYRMARASDSFSWKPSDIAWARAAASPYFFMSSASSEQQSAVEGLAEAYFDAWLAIYREAERVGPEVERAIRRRRDCWVEGLLTSDPNVERVAQLLGEKLTSRLGHAMLRGPDETPRYD
jgi:hypothetical protein